MPPKKSATSTKPKERQVAAAKKKDVLVKQTKSGRVVKKPERLDGTEQSSSPQVCASLVY